MAALSNSGDLLAGLHDANFLRPALAGLNFPALKQIFGEIGVEITVDDGGRAYPQGMDGKGLVRHLVTWLEDHGGRFHWNCPLTDVGTEAGALKGLKIGTRTIPCTQAVMACGGNTWPRTGSDGAAFALLKKSGHIITPLITPLLPALTPLKTREAWPTELKGISIPETEITAMVKGKATDHARGGLLFTHFGISGPAVLDISHCAAKLAGNS